MPGRPHKASKNPTHGKEAEIQKLEKEIKPLQENNARLYGKLGSKPREWSKLSTEDKSKDEIIKLLKARKKALEEDNKRLSPQVNQLKKAQKTALVSGGTDNTLQ